MKRKIIITLVIIIGIFFIYKMSLRVNLNLNYKVGQRIDSLNNVIVYYNGGVANSSGRNLSNDNYNIGMKFQCVEFVKRYYYEYFNHKMPDTYGNAKDFFDSEIGDGELNKKRNLIQYKNRGMSKPKISDLLVFDATYTNKYGHVAIISNVNDNEIEIIQQNPGPFGKSRIKLEINQTNNLWTINQSNVLGWLRIK